MIENILSDLGLAPNESKVYLVLLGLGTQPASVVARKTEMPRNTTRFLLDKLVEKGFVKRATRANTQLYTPEEPKNLINQLEKIRVDQNTMIDKKIESVKSVMPELESRYHPESSKPKVTFYEGDEGLMRAYDDTLTSKEPLRSFACYSQMIERLNDYFQSYFERRVKKGIPIRWIHPDTPRDIEESKRDSKEMREGRLIPHDQYYFTPEIQIYDGKVNITSLKERLGIIIESKEIYEAMAVAFELAWKEANRLDTQVKKKGGAENI